MVLPHSVQSESNAVEALRPASIIMVLGRPQSCFGKLAEIGGRGVDLIQPENTSGGDSTQGRFWPPFCQVEAAYDLGAVQGGADKPRPHPMQAEPISTVI
jgi:hypothetical protein